MDPMSPELWSSIQIPYQLVARPQAPRGLAVKFRISFRRSLIFSRPLNHPDPHPTQPPLLPHPLLWLFRIHRRPSTVQWILQMMRWTFWLATTTTATRVESFVVKNSFQKSNKYIEYASLHSHSIQIEKTCTFLMWLQASIPCNTNSSLCDSFQGLARRHPSDYSASFSSYKDSALLKTIKIQEFNYARTEEEAQENNPKESTNTTDFWSTVSPSGDLSGLQNDVQSLESSGQSFTWDIS